MLASSAANLKKRVERYLELGALPDRRMLVLDILPAFARLGPTAIVGGMVRDLARAGPSGYSSDIDLVLDPYDYEAFRAAVGEMGARENKFGGFGLEFGAWKVDVWALRDTWARTAGHRKVETFADLVDCTFFDWDAVVYDLTRREVTAADGYFRRLRSGVLGINLRENPNELGSAVRAIRRATLWQVAVSEALARYVLDAVHRWGWPALVRLDADAFALPVLENLDWPALKAMLGAPRASPTGPVAGPFTGSAQGLLWDPVLVRS